MTSTPSEDATTMAAAIRAGTLSATEAVAAALERISAAEPAINACTVVLTESALREAAEVDNGIRTGPLAGVPISVKDHVWLEGVAATNGSASLADFLAPVDCVAVSRLRRAGAVVVAKTNNPEFCYRGITDNDVFGLTRNPRDLTRTAGGSSGGAAASVAAGMVPLAIGTDGGGSIRIPSAFCGVYGLKPTFGLIPKLPGFRGWPTLSVTGPIAASIRDLALAVSVMAGPSAQDDLSYPYPGGYLDAVDAPDFGNLRVAVSLDLGFAQLDPDVRAGFQDAVAALERSGTRLTWAHPDTPAPSPLWDSIALPEGFASEGELLARSPHLIGADAAAIIAAGSQISAKALLDAQFQRAGYYRLWADFFDSFDVLVTPTMPTTAFQVKRLAPATIDGVAVPASFDAWCELLLPANLAGLPAVTIPIGTGADGLPIGMQFIGARGADAKVLRAAAAVEAVLAG